MAVKKENKKEKSEDLVFDEEVKKSVEGDAEMSESIEDVKEDSVEEEAPIPVSAVEKLLLNLEERLTNQFNSKLEKLKLKKAKDELSENEAYIQDLEEDWLDVPVVFFAYSINFSIHGDNCRGKATKPPQGAVRFKPIIRSKRKGRKGDEVISVSSIKIQSKSAAEYLRNHSQFGIAFFENMDSVLNIDSGWAQKLVEANQSIQKLSDQQIIARCRQQKIPISADVPSMRKALVADIAEKSLALQHKINYGRLENSVLDKSSDRQIVEKKID